MTEPKTGVQSETALAKRPDSLDREIARATPSFSPQALTAWGDRVAEFEHDVGNLAMTSAARAGDNFVSDHHIERAADFLITRPRDRVAQNVRDVGGIVMGTGLGSIVAFASTGAFGLWFALSFVATLLGTAMFFGSNRR